MSDRDGVKDADYDVLRATGLTREQCWAVLACIRSPQVDPGPELHLVNLRFSGVRIPGEPKEEPDFLEALEMLRELRAEVEDLRAAASLSDDA